MYFVDRKKINATLSYMKVIVPLLEKSQALCSDAIGELALERMAQNIIESITDVGNSMIDGFIMRDPGSYEDIIDILVDEKVIPARMDGPIKEVLALRKMLVRDFVSVNHQEVAITMQENLDVLKQFPEYIEHYLNHELGPVSAFLPEDEA